MKTPQEKKKEYYQKNKERAKEYAKENAEHIARRMKIYRQEKREQLSEQNKEYRKRNIENIKEKVKLKYLQNKDEYLLKQRIRKQEPRTREGILEYQRQWREKNKEARKEYYNRLDITYARYQKSSKDRGHSFLLGIEDFERLVKGNCIYCGDVCNGVDRIENNVGYTLENSVSCCGMCNKMKSVHSKGIFLKQIEKIYLNNNK